MSRQVVRASPSKDPHLVTTRERITFDSREAVWPLSAKTNLDVGALRERVSGALLEGLEATLRSLTGMRAAATVAQYGNVLCHYQSVMYPGGVIPHWNVTDLRNYRAKLMNEFGNETYLVKIRSLLKHWAALRHPGVPEEVVSALNAMTLTQYETGRAVRTNDPNEGPLTPDELHHLTLDVYKACDEGRLDLQDLSLAVFHIVTGRRSGQSAALKCKDVDRTRTADPEPGQQEGERLLLLHVPRLKQGDGFRGSMRSVHLLQAYFALYEAQRDVVAAQLERELHGKGFDLQPKDLAFLQANMPLYPFWQAVNDSITSANELLLHGQHASALDTLRHHAEGQFWHLTSAQVNKQLKRIVDIAGTTSREGTPLQFSPTRLRYTKGTDLARQGVGLEVLAWLMDHSNLESATVYIDNLPEHAAAVNEAMAGSLLLKRVASMFRGSIVNTEADAVAGDDPQHSRIHYKGAGAASCGNRKQCGLGDGVPLACYTCDRFQPWLDGPHDAVLRDLLHERKKTSEALGAEHPLTTQRDKTILAVINVVQRCDERRKALGYQPDGEHV